MVDRISSKTVTSADRKKAPSKTKKTGASSFDALVNQASGGGEVTETAPVQGVSPVMSGLAEHHPQPENEEEVPTNPQERGAYMLKQLENLEQDILSGQMTEAAAKLAKAIQTPAEGNAPSEKMQEVLDEIDLRAGVEVEKLGKKE